jgi:phytoene dehydrogenase-like protein
MAEVIVVGGGLAGLVAARRLAATGQEVTLLERRPTVGGRVRSRRRDGFVLDYGFQVLFERYPAVERELDLEALEVRAFDPGAVIARAGDRSVYGDPRQSPGLLPSVMMSPEIPLRDSWRLFRLQRALAGKDVDELLAGPDRSIAEYLDSWGFAERTVEAFFAPFFGGITLDRSLATDAGVFRAVFTTLARGRAVLPADGMGAIPTQLADGARAAGASIETDTRVEAVSATAGGVSVVTPAETRTADAAVVATDPPTARTLTGVAAIPTSGRGFTTVYASLRRASAPGMGSRLVLNAECDAPNTVAPLSRVAPAYAPDGQHLYSGTFLGDQPDEDARLLDALRTALERWYPEARFGALEIVAVDRIDFAQVAQPPGFRGNLPAIDAPDGRVVLAGDYTRWSSIQGALESGRRAALVVSDSL